MNPTVDNIKTELKKRLDYNTTLCDAWKNVKRTKTKAGTDFKVMSKNFINCRFYDNTYATRTGEKKITVCASSKYNGYVTDEISNIVTLSAYTNADVDPERIIKESPLTPYYFKTADEIEADINKRIAYYERRINEITEGINNTETALKQYIKAFSEMMDTLTETANNSDLCEIIKKNVTDYNYKYYTK